jgi:ubiquinone/menaquinone biosynthesis C-methylase UbiE
MIDFDSINRGFSAKALVYDEYGEHHPAVAWARAQVRGHVLSLLPPGSAILELNAGTGVDAVFFAERGFRVHATDLADEMVAQIRRKVEAHHLSERLTVQQISFTELEHVTGGPYDLVFSNFGGLNCIPDLRLAARGLPRLLKPDGLVTWVIMPPVCPWELAQALRGHFKTAFRRLRRGGVRAHVEGARFMTYYFTPAHALCALGPGWRRVALRSLSLLSPPSFMENFPRRFPALFRLLAALDERAGRLPLLNSWGDFFILTSRFVPR